jgi:hypothetical protein
MDRGGGRRVATGPRIGVDFNPRFRFKTGFSVAERRTGVWTFRRGLWPDFVA